jgi:Tfp pilus assembly pilus retraction ATPase PilT
MATRNNGPWGCHVKPIDDLLREMMARNASDLHIKAGSPPVMRIDG